MNRNIINIALILVMGAVFGFTSCNKEPDESNLYTKTGMTIEDFLQNNDADLSMFNAIMARTGYDRIMSAYGQYTCFAPTNAGVQAYLDSLMNDPKGRNDSHGNKNGLTSATVDGMSDSLALDFVKIHLCDGEISELKMGGGKSISTMLDRQILTYVNSDNHIYLGDMKPATIISKDKDLSTEMTNGYVYVVDNAITYSSKKIPDVLEDCNSNTDNTKKYSIFLEALKATGLDEVIGKDCKTDKGITYNMGDNHNDTNGSELWYPTTCKIGYTLFAESDSIMHKNNIYNLHDLYTRCKGWYGGAKEWYSYLSDLNIDVNTDENDMKNPFNVVHMFVAYHILYAAMAADQLVFDRNDNYSDTKWNYTYGGEPYDYYETMLPHTMMKIWQPISTRGTDLKNRKQDSNNGNTNYINRWILYNTFTNELGTMGTEDFHKYEQQGVEVSRSVMSAYNGYIHPIKDMLIYDTNVPNGVLNERIRLEATTFLPEFINNGIRNATNSQISAKNGGGSGARVAFYSSEAYTYFDNVVVFNNTSALRYNVKGEFRAYQADAFQGWGQYDLAVRFPSVPKTGEWELRIFYSPMSHGGMMQFYYGTSSARNKFTALSIPLDVRIDESDPRIGWTDPSTEDDAGVTTDKQMRNRGYMRAPCSFMGHPKATGYNTGVYKMAHGLSAAEVNAVMNGVNSCRTDGTVTLRRILTTQTFRQCDENWLRIKSVINDDTDLKWQIDFIELVPKNLLDNDAFTEDWY